MLRVKPLGAFAVFVACFSLVANYVLNLQPPIWALWALVALMVVGLFLTIGFATALDNGHSISQSAVRGFRDGLRLLLFWSAWIGGLFALSLILWAVSLAM